MTATICFFAQFTASKIGKNSIAVTWDVDQITRADGSRSALVTGGATNITIGRRGLYGYYLAGADLTLYDYVATAITADATVDQQEIAALWTMWSLSWHDIATSIMTVIGSIGKLLVDNINATISSRSTYAGTDTAGTTTMLADYARRTGDYSTLTAAQVWASATRTLTSYGTLIADIWAYVTRTLTSTSGVVPTVAQIWQYTWRTLTTGSATSGPVVETGTILAYGTDTFHYSITDLGTFTNYITIYFTVKASKKNTDAESILQVSKKASGVGDGLLYVNKAAATDASKGSITIDSATTGNITIDINASIMAQLKSGEYYADVKIVRSAGVLVETLQDYTFEIADTATKAVS